MNHYPAFLRPNHGKSTNSTSNSSSSNNENDENSTIKNLIFKHLSKVQQNSTNNNNTKGTMRGILGEVGNMTLSTKPIITKPKIVQQQQSVATIIESKSIINVPASLMPIVVNKMEEITLNDECISHEPIIKLTKVPSEFDCDSGDLHNITTVSDYVVDICIYWRDLEQHTSIRQNFLSNRNEGKEKKKARIVYVMYFVYHRHSFISESSCTY
jgi:hypothetical protein